MQFMIVLSHGICGISHPLSGVSHPLSESLILPPESPISSLEFAEPTTPQEPQSSTDEPLASQQPPPNLSGYIATTLELVGVAHNISCVLTRILLI